MTWREIASNYGYDNDTQSLLQIAVDFLVMFFGYRRDMADQVMTAFLASYSQDFGEDDLHHELSYGIAAIAHYLISLEGPRESLGDWLMETGHNKTPEEALEYFREHYFFR